MKKLIKLFSLLLVLNTLSCSSVRVSADYDKEINFKDYSSFAFSKNGIDKVKINDLDKKRILKAIEVELSALGIKKNAIQPDLIVNIFTSVNQEISFHNSNNHFGYGWGPWYNYNNIYNSTQGLLYIDFIDFKKNQLIWQGKGKGYISENTSKKEEQIKLIVNKILLQYPPIN